MPRITDLPPELRNKIYDLIIPREEKYPLRPWGLKSVPALCRISSSLRAEMLPMRRAWNSFFMGSVEAADAIAAYGESGLKLVQHLELVHHWMISCAPRRPFSYPHGITIKMTLYIEGGEYHVQYYVPSFARQSHKSFQALKQAPGVRQAMEAPICGVVEMMKVELERELVEKHTTAS